MAGGSTSVGPGTPHKEEPMHTNTLSNSFPESETVSDALLKTAVGGLDFNESVKSMLLLLLLL